MCSQSPRPPHTLSSGGKDTERRRGLRSLQAPPFVGARSVLPPPPPAMVCTATYAQRPTHPVFPRSPGRVRPEHLCVPHRRRGPCRRRGRRRWGLGLCGPARVHLGAAAGAPGRGQGQGGQGVGAGVQGVLRALGGSRRGRGDPRMQGIGLRVQCAGQPRGTGRCARDLRLRGRGACLGALVRRICGRVECAGGAVGGGGGEERAMQSPALQLPPPPYTTRNTRRG